MSADRPFARISLHVGDESRAECFTYTTSTPILDIRAGNASVAISIARRDIIDDTAVQFARELAQQAQAFAAEVERLHAESTAPGAADPAEPDESAERAA
jgi:hypothetical protein